MSNPYFAFKQFTVHQDSCAMKVSTDACIQGAWTPVSRTMKHVLDIGAGTGLLSLMIAQRLPEAQIDALELNEAAAIQASQNAIASPFSERIHVVQADACSWIAPGRYDLIICNPPFFKDSLHGPDAGRNAARHAATINPQSLIRILEQNLSADGAASVMWPPPEHEFFERPAAASGIYLNAMLQVRDAAGSRITRVIGMYGRKAVAQVAREALIIKSEGGNYTEAFTALLSSFYLHL